MSSTLTPISPSRSILIFTCSEFGQANVTLALLYELLRNDNGFDIHIASHKRLQSRVDTLTVDLDRKATFHAVPLPTLEEYWERSGEVATHAPGFSAVTGYRRIAPVLAGYSLSEYAVAYDVCIKIIQDVRPACVANDMLFPMGFDACHALKVPALRISPLSLQHEAADAQPKLAAFWKYPFVGTGLPYPIPWHLIPVNIYLFVQIIRVYMLSPQIANLNKFRKESLGITTPWPQFQPPSPDFPCLTAGLPELDFPVKVPEYVKPCGPIVLPSKSLQESDPELAEWLDKPARGTVLVQMGTHWESFASDYEKDVSEMAHGIKSLLDDVPDVQVLWKLKLSPKPGSDFPTKPAPEANGDGSTPSASNSASNLIQVLHSPQYASRIRVTSWLRANPSSILSSTSAQPPHQAHITAVVHHGGANSFFEAARAGVPQIVLPVWYDTYDFAVKAEYLGVGVWASRGSAPEVDGRQLGEALTRVVGDVKEMGVRDRARRLGEVVRGEGQGRGQRQEGRERAAGEVVGFAERKLGDWEREREPEREVEEGGMGR